MQNEKVVLITGAAKRLGATIAVAYTLQGMALPFITILLPKMHKHYVKNSIN